MSDIDAALHETSGYAGLPYELQLLSTEYQTLRAEIIARASARFQLLSVGGGAAAILAAAATAAPEGRPVGASLILAAALLVVGVSAYVRIGRLIGRLARRVVLIERRVNLLMKGAFGTPPVLEWEQSQVSSVFRRLSYGAPLPPPA